MSTTGPWLSVIVPMLNEGDAIEATLDAINKGAGGAEMIVVDGGSEDGSVELATARCDLMLRGERGRARQMNAGAARASGAALAFVHADTVVPTSFSADIAAALGDSDVVGGRFDVELDDAALPYRIIGRMISWRSRLSRTATGDQAIFVRRQAFEELGGFADYPICEDLDFARRLKRLGKIACLRSRVVTSSRRWRKRGVMRTILRMWAIRALYLCGVSPRRLHSYYVDTR